MKVVVTHIDESQHKANIDALLDQFKINCHRTLEAFLKEPHPQISGRTMNSDNSWLAKMIIAYEGMEWGKFSVDTIATDYRRFVGWMRYY